MASAQAALLMAAKSGGALVSLSLTSSTTSSAATIAWPGSLQAGDVAILSDAALETFSAVSAVVPSGFTALVNASAGTSGQPRLIESYKILTGSEVGNITGMNTGGSFKGKLLRIFRADRPITGVAPSTWNAEVTSGNPSAQNVAVPPSGSIVLGTALGSGGSAAFTTASPSFDTTQDYGLSMAISGHKIYVTSPAGHAVDMADLGNNILASGFLVLS